MFPQPETQHDVEPHPTHWAAASPQQRAATKALKNQWEPDYVACDLGI